MKIHTLRVPTPFPIGPVNLFLIEADPLTLIDTGPNMDEAFRSLNEQLERLKLRIEQVRRVIVTHAHEDHAGLAARIQQMSGAAVCVHPWDAPRLSGEQRYLVGHQLLRRAGVPAEAIEQMQQRREYHRRLMQPVTDVQLLREGDEVPFASESWRVLHTPGHTPGHLCLWHEGKRLLIGGDTILKRVSPNPVINPDPRNPDRRFPSLAMYLDTLARLRDIGPTRVHTGHGEDVNDLHAYYTASLQHARQRQARLLDLFPPQAATAWELSFRLFPDAREDQRFLALSETSAHLDWATEQGKLKREERDGIEYYRRA